MGKWALMDARIPGETYRERAAEIRALARQAKMPENRDELLALASRYDRLAEQVRRLRSES